MEIVGKTVVITGGASGMGAQAALYLGQKGAKVAILDLNIKDATAQQGMSLRCDVTQEDAVDAALLAVQAKLGTPQICVNCAGIAPAQRIVGREGPMPLENFNKVIAINLIGTFNVLRSVAALMSKAEPIGDDQERGVIINTASIAAFEGQVGQAAYSASKGGVCALTLPAARELAHWNIRVMTIAPGLIMTPLLESLPEAVHSKLAAQVVFPKRLGKPSEFASLVGHIIENPYLNGEVIRLDGGLRMPA